MESATPTTQGVSNSELNSVIALLWAIGATLWVSIVVFGHWGIYDWMKRVLAILLIFNMLIFPLHLAFTKTGRMNVLRSARASELTLGYVGVMIATLVFSRL